MSLRAAFFALALFFSSSVFAQDRVNRPKLVFDSASAVFDKATGWDYNETAGEWVDYENVLCADKDFKDNYKSLQGEYMKSQTGQNFNTMQTKAFTYNGKRYYVVIVDKWDGAYEYPNIKRNWQTFQTFGGFIFPEREYRKLQLRDTMVVLKTKLFVKMDLKYDDKAYDEARFLDLIQTKMATTKAYDSDYLFPVKRTKSGAIRFKVPDMDVYFNRLDLKDEYFETEAANFSRLVLR